MNRNKGCLLYTSTPYPDHRLGRTLPDGSRPVLQRELRHPYRCGDGGCANEEEFLKLAESSFAFSKQILVEESLKGWKKSNLK